MSRAGNRIPSSERGAVVLAAMIFTAVMAIAVAGYQVMCYNTLKNGTRTAQSTRSLELAELGIEEALYTLNQASPSWTGWTLAGGNATRTLSNFAFETGSSGSVTITVTGYAGTKPGIAATATTTDSYGDTQSRTLSVSTGASSGSTTGRAPLFSNAIVAIGSGSNGTAANGTGQVIFYYNGITVDSFDFSAGTGYSAAGAGYAAVVAAQTSSTGDNSIYSTANTGSISLGTATVKGYAATTPTSSGGVSFTSTTGGQLIGPNSGTTKIDTSRQSTSPYQPAFTVTTPANTGNYLAAPAGTVTIGTPGAASPTTYYATIDASGNFDIENAGVLQVDGPVNLVVAGNFYVGAYYNTGSIVIRPGGSLNVFVSGYTYISGSGISNQTLQPKNLAIFGTSTFNPYVLIYTNTPFHGVVYAPKADLYLYGRATTSEFSGSFVGRNAWVYNFVATMKVHYDTSLRDTTQFTSVTSPFAVSSVLEQ